MVRPRYTVIVRNGRATCGNPPIQQTPRSGGYRELFKASPGHLLLAVDYDFIELCTLGAVCEARYGTSVLANVIRGVRLLLLPPPRNTSPVGHVLNPFHLREWIRTHSLLLCSRAYLCQSSCPGSITATLPLKLNLLHCDKEPR